MAPETAKARAVQYAHQLVADTGGEGTLKEIGVSISPCEGRAGELAEDGKYFVQGAYQILTPAGRAKPVLERLREGLRSRGWQITKDEAKPGTDVRALDIRNPGDGYTSDISNLDDATLTVGIYSPCLQPENRSQVDW